MRNIAILGSTGSIGTQTLDIIRKQPGLKVTALSAGRNTKLLEEQIREFHPGLVSEQDEDSAKDLRVRIADLDTKVVSGMDGLLAVATEPASELLVTAIVGMIGLRPTVAAIKAGKNIALANKETLVTAGHIIMPLAKEFGVSILQVDSEHSAIFQCLQGESMNPIDKILLTASGGPFRGRKTEELRQMKAADALKHPNWSMGKKITVDSATLVNKGLEMIEAGWLFSVGADQIEVVVHPQSIIHSAVQYADGAVIAQLGIPDMHLPIQYALFYPDRKPLPQEKLDLFALGSLTFERPDEETFRGLALARKAMKTGGNLPTVLNAANERAVALFLQDRIPFLKIAEIIEESMENIPFIEAPDLSQILETEALVYERIDKVEV